jgi:hypothetical protein
VDIVGEVIDMGEAGAKRVAGDVFLGDEINIVNGVTFF